jgi:hypothetical protein
VAPRRPQHRHEGRSLLRRPLNHRPRALDFLRWHHPAEEVLLLPPRREIRARVSHRTERRGAPAPLPRKRSGGPSRGVSIRPVVRPHRFKRRGTPRRVGRGSPEPSERRWSSPARGTRSTPWAPRTCGNRRRLRRSRMSLSQESNTAKSSPCSCQAIDVIDVPHRPGAQMTMRDMGRPCQWLMRQGRMFAAAPIRPPPSSLLPCPRG